VSDVLSTEIAERIRTLTLNRPDSATHRRANRVIGCFQRSSMPRSTPRSTWSSSPVLIRLLRGLDLTELSSGLIDGDRGVELTKFPRPDVPTQ
jgi:hypothetical protein